MIEEPTTPGFYWIRTCGAVPRSVVVEMTDRFIGKPEWAWSNADFGDWKRLVAVFEPTAIEPVAPPSWEKKAAEPMISIPISKLREWQDIAYQNHDEAALTIGDGISEILPPLPGLSP